MKIIVLCVLAFCTVLVQGKSVDERLIEAIKQMLVRDEEAPQEESKNSRELTISQAKSVDERLEEALDKLLARDDEETPQEESKNSRELDDSAEILLEEANGKSVSRNYRSVLQTREAVPHSTYICYQEGQSKPESLRTSVLWSHNYLRKLHDTKPLKWDKDLAEASQKHANWMAKYEALEHTAAAGYGENIGYVGLSLSPCLFGPSTIVKNWYNEVVSPGYNFGSEQGGAETGHFSQVVWAHTKKIGCGLATVEVGKWAKTYMTCQYYPAGNVAGQFEKNVKAPPAGVKRAELADIDIDGACDFFTKCSKYRKFCSILGNACSSTCQ